MVPPLPGTWEVLSQYWNDRKSQGQNRLRMERKIALSLYPFCVWPVAGHSPASLSSLRYLSYIRPAWMQHPSPATNHMLHPSICSKPPTRVWEKVGKSRRQQSLTQSKATFPDHICGSQGYPEEYRHLCSEECHPTLYLTQFPSSGRLGTPGVIPDSFFL